MIDFIIRPAVVTDSALIFNFIKELAAYENLTDQVTATEELLTEWIFDKQKAEAVIGEVDGIPVGYALFYYNMSSFDGRAGMFIEDLFIRPTYRRRGYGKRFFQYLASLCLERGCGRLEWSCLNWNTPSIEFYQSMGALPRNAWTNYKLNENSMKILAGD